MVPLNLSIEAARKVLTPPVDEVLWAPRVIQEMGYGNGCVAIGGQTQEDASYKQCQVMVNAVQRIGLRDPEYARACGFRPADLAEA